MALISFTTDGLGTGGEGDLKTVTLDGNVFINAYGSLGTGPGIVTVKFIDHEGN